MRKQKKNASKKADGTSRKNIRNKGKKTSNRYPLDTLKVEPDERSIPWSRHKV